jgi:transposase InsO family protein
VGKHHRDPFPAKALHRATRLLECIHSNLHKVPVPTASGYRYWITFINNWSRYGWIWLLKKKSDAFEAFKAFKAHVELQFGAKIACLHDDKGGEYIGHLWDAFFAEHGIRREHTVEGMLQQGGIAECRNRTLEEHVVAMLNGARLPTRFWGKVLYTYGCLLNMTPLSAIPPDTTPYEMVHKRKPNYSTLRVFGCCAWAHVRRKKRRSLEPHAKPCVFLGVPDDFKGWKLWDLSAQGGCGGVIISRDVIWNEEEFPGLSKDAHDPIPAHFGRINAKTPASAKPSMPASEESAEDSDEQEGYTLPLPALVPLNNDPTEEPPLPTLSSSSSDAPLPLPPALCTPPHPATALRMPDTPQLPQRQSALRLACQRIPELFPPLKTLPVLSRCSRRSTAGVLPNPCLSATQYLQEGHPAPVCVATYSKTRSSLQSVVLLSAPTSCEPMLAASEPVAPSIVKEEADTPAPGPSQTTNVSYNKFDFLMPTAAHLAQHWMGKCALLAQGLEAIYSNSNEFIPYHKALEHAFMAGTDASKPKLFHKAMQHPDANLWYKAAVKEMQVHIKNGTWELVKLPPRHKVIGSKWVFKVKCNANSSIERYKA